jgi:hypothetical protein
MSSRAGIRSSLIRATPSVSSRSKTLTRVRLSICVLIRIASKKIDFSIVEQKVEAVEIFANLSECDLNVNER